MRLRLHADDSVLQIDQDEGRFLWVELQLQFFHRVFRKREYRLVFPKR
jgi:hypothetical protein